MSPTSTPVPELARRDFLGRIAVFLAGLVAFGRPGRAQAKVLSTEPYLGEIMPFAFDFPPRGWATCDGQILPIVQNTALFSLLGTTYGGNGQTTFALPDLRGRSPMHWGQGAGLTNRSWGERAGESTHTLVLNELPTHTHGVQCSSAAGTSASPAGMVLARNAGSVPGYAVSADTALAAGAIANAGGGQGHQNQQPLLAINYCIALQGVFPPRS